MNANRGPSPWLMLAALMAVVAVSAALGAVQAPSGADQARAGLHTALQATVAASGYTEDFKQTSPQGTDEYHLVYQAPDRLSGYHTVAGRRLYVSAVGTTFYEGVSGAPGGGQSSARYIGQPSRPASTIDPVQQDFTLLVRDTGRAVNVTRVGDVYTFDVAQIGHFTVTVTGPYATSMVVQGAGGTDVLEVGGIDSSPPAFVPSRSQLVG